MINWPKDRFLHVNTYRVRYWDEGDRSAMTILLVHGINASVEYWIENIWELSKKYRVIAVDLIGFGQSDKPNLTYSLSEFTIFLMSFITILKLDKIAMVGHSLGGGIASDFAAHHSNRLSHLILVSPAGYDRRLPLSFKLLKLPFSRAILKFTRSRQFEVAIKHWAFRKSMIKKELINRVYQNFKTFGGAQTTLKIIKKFVSWRGIREQILSDIAQTIGQIAALPVLLIWGKNDNLLSVEASKCVQTLIPQVEIRIFDQCGHLPQIECSSSFNQAVDTFLSLSSK